MAALKSRLFVATDDSTSAKLEACATGQPNEHSTHFSVTVNSQGEHVRLVQVALSRIKNRELNLRIPEFSIDGNYSDNFAKAVFAYKDARGIKNFASTIDNIVGMQTIFRLDREQGDDAGDLPLPGIPPDIFKPVPTKAITRRVFVNVVQTGGAPAKPDGAGIETKDVIEALGQIFSSVQDPDFFLGKENARLGKIDLVMEDLVVNNVEQNTDVDIRTDGGAVVTATTTTTFNYTYGVARPSIVFDSKFTSSPDGTDQRTTVRDVKMLPRSVAQKSEVLVPPRPR